VIGRTSKPCDGYPLLDGITEHRECHGGKIHRTGPPGTYGLAVDDCLMCNGTGRVPCNDIPWNYPEDMAHFREATMGHAAVWGRRSWENLTEVPRDGDRRLNIVVSKTLCDHASDAAVGALLEPTLEAALSTCRRHWSPPHFGEKRIYVRGGAQLYEAALPFATHLDLTLIDHDYEGDVRFPRGRAFVSAGLGHAVAFRPPLDFDLVKSRKGVHPHLTFTKWQRR
jgi:dihydrofolate reductase